MKEIVNFTGRKWYGMPPRFDPEEGETVVAAPGKGYGYWAGAPNSTYDPVNKKFYLYCRLRTPLLQERGGVCQILESGDGVNYKVAWEGNKNEFKANSIEKGSIIQDPVSGKWRLYLSYEVSGAYDRNPPTWRVDLMEADTPSAFDPRFSRPVIDAPMFGFTFVKDPTVCIVGGEYFVYTNVGFSDQHDPENGDGLIKTRGRGWTALHRSGDGVRFSNAKIVLSPRKTGWDGFNTRMTSICYLPPLWLAFYDGATHRADTYDEFCGLATSMDLEKFSMINEDGPWIKSPHGSGSIRYLDALPVGNTLHYYYEYCLADGSHELRHNAVDITA